MATSDNAMIAVRNVGHAYGNHQALNGLTFDVSSGQIFGLLGPNGSGKTTLFRLISTLLPLQSGTIHLSDCNVAESPQQARRLIGVTFQSPSLDGKLSVRENLQYQGHLYGLWAKSLTNRMDTLLIAFGLQDRVHQIAETLSGGLKRRVEIAKSLLHSPKILLLDEPSTGLDPSARIDLWEVLSRLSRNEGVTILLTTHLMEEADRCDRLGILDHGSLVAIGSPTELKNELAGDCITIQTESPDHMQSQLASINIKARPVGNTLVFESANAVDQMAEIVSKFRNDITEISLGTPRLEDVFVQKTGHRFWDADHTEQTESSA